MADPQHPGLPAVGDRVLYYTGISGINLPVGDPAARRLMPNDAEVIEWPVPGQRPEMARLRLRTDGEERIAAYSLEPAELCWSWPPPA